MDYCECRRCYGFSISIFTKQILCNTQKQIYLIMKINFAQLEVYTDIQKTNKICMDARQQLGELIYEVGSGIKAHSLALKIYNSEGELEYTDEEVQVIMKFVNQYCKPAIIDAMNALKTEDK